MARTAVIQGRFFGGRPLMRALQAKPATQGFATEVPSTVLNLGRRGAGMAMPETVRSKMESALAADFSDVRIHVGTEASTIGALAFTYGSDIYFAPGLYDPHTTHGQRLLGHELTHVVQQRAGRVRNPFGGGVAVVQDPGLEAEADRLGMMAASHRPCGASCAQQKPSTTSQSQKSAQTKTAPAAAPGAAHFRAALAQAKLGGPRPGVAGHVQTAVAQPRAGAPTHVAQKKSSEYKLVLGTYLHDRNDASSPLPEDLAGHTFVAIEGPQGREAWGFSPADRAYDPLRDLGRLRTGVEGRIHDDARAFNKPGVRTKSFEIDAVQAQAARTKVAEYRKQHLGFSLQRRQCATFALDVARAAHVNVFPGSQVVKPRDMYNHL